MRARITGADHVWLHKSGKLRVRVDFFPDPGDPLYDGCHVRVPERPLTPEEQAQVDAAPTPEERAAVLEQILAGIPKVWRVNPINCHMFLLPVGFTPDDLDGAVRERMAALKQQMSLTEAMGYGELQGLSPELRPATRPPQGEGQALIPTQEKEWTPALVQQAGMVLNGREVEEVESAGGET
jgi:hypothetical protein